MSQPAGSVRGGQARERALVSARQRRSAMNSPSCRYALTRRRSLSLSEARSRARRCRNRFGGADIMVFVLNSEKSFESARPGSNSGPFRCVRNDAGVAPGRPGSRMPRRNCRVPRFRCDRASRPRRCRRLSAGARTRRCAGARGEFYRMQVECGFVRSFCLDIASHKSGRRSGAFENLERALAKGGIGA